MRTSIEYVRGYARRRKTRTSSEYVRQENAYVTGTRSHNIRTSSDHVRQANTYARQEKTCVTGTRTSSKCTSPECVREKGAYVVDLQMRTPNLHLHGRSWNTMSSLRWQTDLETFANAAYNRPCSKRPSFRSRHAQADRRTYRITKITTIM